MAIVHLITQQGEGLATKTDIAELKTQLLIYMIAIAGLVIASVAALNKLL